LKGTTITVLKANQLTPRSFFKVFKKIFFQKLYDIISYMQLVVYHPLLPVTFPANMILINDELIEISTFDLWPTDDWFPPIFKFDEAKFEPLNERYNDFKFET
jgi:hypothetical protein